ncbi:hypothetical protein B0H11DRAFT_1299589 [Mycena galericulata]|nr:hypothetical protein B0H11DRAFT_1299589 [Mycena galericulata]
MAPQVWFITGATRGLGRCMTELVLRNGDIAVATARNPLVLENDLRPKYDQSKLLVLGVDVAHASQIKDAFAKATEAFGKIDVVFNNAAAFQGGEAEGIPQDAARKVFDVNFWGAVNVSLEAIRVFREVNSPQGGRLLNISSATGFAPMPGTSYYVASKFALEGFSEAVRMELDPAWNIKITVIEPGGYATGWEKGMEMFPHHPAYNFPHMPTVMGRAMFKDFQGFDGDPEKAVQILYFKLAKSANPPKLLPLGQDVQYMVATKIQSMQAEIDEYKAWSEGLKRTDPPLVL